MNSPPTGTKIENLPIYLNGLNIAATEFTKEGLGHLIRLHLAKVKAADAAGESVAL